MLRLAALCCLILLAGCSKGSNSTTQNIGGVRYTPPSGTRRVNANAELKKQQASREKQEKALRQLNGQPDEEENASSRKTKKNDGVFGN